MNKCISVFGQILQILNQYEFERMVRKAQSEKGTKGFSFLVSVCGHAVLSMKSNAFLSRDLWRTGDLLEENKNTEE